MSFDHDNNSNENLKSGSLLLFAVALAVLFPLVCGCCGGLLGLFRDSEQNYAETQPGSDSYEVEEHESVDIAFEQSGTRSKEGDEFLDTWITSDAEGIAPDGPDFSQDELSAIAGRITNNREMFRAGTSLSEVIKRLGRPTKFSRHSPLPTLSPEQRQKILNDPRFSQSSIDSMSSFIESCMWSCSEGDYWVIIMFRNGQLKNGPESFDIKLP